MAKKVITVQEAIQVGFYVSDTISRAGEAGGLEKTSGARAYHTNEGYPWREQTFKVWKRGQFQILATRTKHTDGRIRDTYHKVSGTLAFALFCIKHHPETHQLVAEWAKRILDPVSLAFSLETKAEKKFIRDQVKLYGAPATVADAEALIVGAGLMREAA